MPDPAEVTELDLRILIAVDATRGDRSAIVGEIKEHGWTRVDTSQVRRETRRMRKLVTQDSDDNCRLTAEGRRAALQAAERFRQLADYAVRTLG